MGEFAATASVKERTGSSARRLKKHKASDWLVLPDDDRPRFGGTLSVAAQTYKDGRYLEIQPVDQAGAPKDRMWSVTMIDRETWRTVTLRGSGQRELTAEALKQIGALD